MPIQTSEPMEVPMEVDSEEETKAPTVSEARARFDQPDTAPTKKVSKVQIQPKGPPMAPVGAPVTEWVGQKVEPPVQKPTPPAPARKPEQPMRTELNVKSPSPRC